jgi:hypothetical protein
MLVQNKKPGTGTIFQRILSDQFLRQIKIKIGSFHKVSFSRSAQ